MPDTANISEAAPLPDPLWEATQLDGQSAEDKARVAVAHALGQMRDNGIIGYQMGIGGQAFALLTEALAALMNLPVRVVRERFVCRRAVRVDSEDAARLDWLQARLLEMPSAYGDLIGLPGRWTSIREAIDDARAQAR